MICLGEFSGDVGRTIIYDIMKIKNFVSDSVARRRGESERLTRARKASCAMFFQLEDGQIGWAQQVRITQSHQLVSTKEFQISNHVAFFKIFLQPTAL